MNGQHHGGKGSAQRPANQAKFDSNWDAIFGAKPGTPPNYIWHCTKCGSDLTAEDTWQEVIKESFDIGECTVWEIAAMDRCENCGSDELIEYRGTEQ